MKFSNVTKALVFLTMLLATNVCSAQYGSKDTVKINAQDTASLAIEGRALGKELVLLRDSISTSIQKLQVSESKASGKNKDKLQQAGHNLTLNKQRLETDIKEIFTQTSSKGWNSDLVKRVKVDTEEIRRTYKRILKDVKPYTASRS